jgi:hypothetical protein
MPSLINSDDGVVSGSAGLKTTGGNDGILVFQSSGTETARITSGVLAVSATSTTASTVRLYEDTDNGSNYVDLIAPTSVASNKTITLPDSTGTVVVGSAAVSAVGQIPFSTDGSSYTPTVKIVSGAAITLTNQTGPEFTGIPSWVKRITLMLNNVQTNGTAPPLIQLGTGSTTYTTSGYAGTNSVTLAASSGAVNFTTGFGIGVNTTNWSGTATVNGLVTISNLTGDTWACSGSFGRGDAGVALYFTAGSVALGATLTAVRLFINGTQLFDGGTFNIMWE